MLVNVLNKRTCFSSEVAEEIHGLHQCLNESHSHSGHSKTKAVLKILPLFNAKNGSLDVLDGNDLFIIVECKFFQCDFFNLIKCQ